MTRLPRSALALLLLAGCATERVTAPSLLPRAIETRSDAEPERPVPVATADPALDADIAGLVARREKVSAEFAVADHTARARLDAGSRAAVGTDAWLDAQTALAALDTPRADLLAILTELEQLAAARAAAGQPAYPGLDAARVDTETELDRIGALVAERKARLPIQ